MNWSLKLSITEIFGDTVQAQKPMAYSSPVQNYIKKMVVDTHKHNFKSNIPCESEVNVFKILQNAHRYSQMQEYRQHSKYN